MKQIKSFRGLILMLLLAISLLTTSCGSLSNMSYEDAYDIGWGAGVLLRNIVDN